MIYLFGFLSLIFASITAASDCHCKDIEPIYTADCCLGSGGELRNDNGAVHCIFNDYNNFGSFNRCCDSYWGIARCVLSPRPELDEFMKSLQTGQQLSPEDEEQQPNQPLPPSIALPNQMQEQQQQPPQQEQAPAAQSSSPPSPQQPQPIPDAQSPTQK